NSQHGGLPDMIYGSVMASNPKTMQDAIEMATEMMDKKISTLAERQAKIRGNLTTTTKLNNNLPRDRTWLKLTPLGLVRGRREVRFGKRGKLNPKYVAQSKVMEKVGSVAYKLEFPQELSRVHNTFHVSNLKKCYVDEPLVVPLDRLHFDDKLQFVEEPVEIMDREVKRLRQIRILLFKV
ncbi:hypothetical protein Tco_1496084, partial [Tanacetum coccineum]